MDGALTVPPRVQAVPPVRNTSASSMQSPPASADATSVIIVWSVSTDVPDEFGQAEVPRQGGRKEQPGIRLEFRGATITSDAGLLACRELDDALGLTETANECLQESRGGRNVQHRLVGLLRQSVYSRLAGYEDTNDAERLAQDPTMRIIVGRRDIDRPAASTNTMSRFETEVLTQDGNVEGLDRLNAK